MSNITGFTCGTFDLLHAGHITMLESAKEQCDILLVGIQVDPNRERPDKRKPVQTIYERVIQICALNVVDGYFIYETEDDLKNLLSTQRIDKRFLGADWLKKMYAITGLDICEDRDIEIVFLDRSHNYSTSELRQRVYAAENYERSYRNLKEED